MIFIGALVFFLIIAVVLEIFDNRMLKHEIRRGIRALEKMANAKD
jgi:hypothetical protein